MVALAISVVPVEPELVGKDRYLEMARVFGPTAYEQLTCGCHVHAGVFSEEEGVAALDRVGPWWKPAGSGLVRPARTGRQDRSRTIRGYRTFLQGRRCIDTRADRALGYAGP